jgi:hypothetical protein
MLAAALPTVEGLSKGVLARQLEGQEFPRNPTLEQYAFRAALARSTGDRSLGATVTDLTAEAANRLDHSPFDPVVPKGLTLFDRVEACALLIGDDSPDAVARSMSGTLPRAKANGLGFDATRIAESTSTDSSKYVDPVVECFAFMGLQAFPVRGAGSLRATTRGWSKPASRTGAFVWPVWEGWLDVDAIECLLDEVYLLAAQSRTGWADGRCSDRLRFYGVRSLLESVPYRPTGTSDTTRGYSSRLAWTA